MADISQIKLPNGTTYNIKDSGAARTLANLSDTNVSGASAGSLLSFDGNQWTDSNAVYIKDNGRTVASMTPTNTGGMVQINNGLGANCFNMFVGSNGDGIIDCKDANGVVRASLAGVGTVNVFDSNENKTAYLNGDEGKLYCNKISVRNVTYTLTKSSGSWTIDSVTAKRTGNVVQIRIALKGNGSAVSAGSNGFVGTLGTGTMPVQGIKLFTYYKSSPLMIDLKTDGTVTARVCAANTTVTNGEVINFDGTFIVDD